MVMKSYLPVIIPGIMVQTVILTSIVTGTPVARGHGQGVFDRFRSLPIAGSAAGPARCSPA